MRPSVLLAAATLLAAPTGATELPVRSVTLSNAGLMQIERAGTLAPGDAIAFRAPTEDVDDLLKSLVVLDPAGTVEGVRLPARDTAEEAFRGLPLRPADFESRVRLLQALRGQEVEAGGAAGRLADAQEGERGALHLTLITAQGLAAVPLREGDEVRLLDAALAERVRRAAEALAAARSEDVRQVEIALRADRAREVSVVYVAGAPLWKPSYRLLVPRGAGEARLLGWAVVENRSGADWAGVRLALVSGNPAAYRQPLYEPIRVARPELPVRAADRVIVRPDTGPRPPPPPVAAPAPQAMAARSAPGGGARDEAAEIGARFREAVAPAPQAVATSTAGRVAFTLPAPVSIRSGETANVPFLDAPLPAERIWWVQDLNATNPLQAVRFTNATGRTLPDGLATVYGADGAEGGAFLGDAEIRAVSPGEMRIIAFARDRDVLLSTAAATSERPLRVELQRGAVVLRTQVREERALAVDPRGASGRLVVDLPRRPGATPRFTVAAEGDFGLRHEAMLAGEATTLRFAFEREGRSDIRLWDEGLGDLVVLHWRRFDVERNLRRLPGGPGTLEALREVLARLPGDAPGRDALEAVIADMGEARRLLDALRERLRAYQSADAALDRARRAAEDRTGPAREEARKALNAASAEAERTGALADTAWEAWQSRVQALLARG
jgi:hypothetical protein